MGLDPAVRAVPRCRSSTLAPAAVAAATSTCSCCSASASRSRTSTTRRSASSVPLVYPLLLYLLRAHAVVGHRARRRPAARLRLQRPRGVAGASALIFLVGFRIGLNVTNSNVIDVGYAGVIGADRLVHGRPPLRRVPERQRARRHLRPGQLRRLRAVRAGAAVARDAGTTCRPPTRAAILFDVLCCAAAVPDRPARARPGPRHRAGLRVGRLPVHALRAEHELQRRARRRRSCSPRCSSRRQRAGARALFGALAGLTKFAPLRARRPCSRCTGRARLTGVRCSRSLGDRADRLRRRSSSTARTSARSGTARSASRPTRGSPFSVWGYSGRPGRIGAARVAGVRRVPRGRAGVRPAPARHRRPGRAVRRGPDRAPARRDPLVLPLHRVVLPAGHAWRCSAPAPARSPPPDSGSRRST